MESREVDVDGIQHRLGSGRFQILVFLALGLIYSRGAWHVFGIMFLAGDPGHQCALPHHAQPPALSSSDDYSSSLLTDDDGKSPGQPSDFLSSPNHTGIYDDSRSAVEVLPTTLDIRRAVYSSPAEGVSIDLTSTNWTADSCKVSFVTQNGSEVRLASDCPYGWSYGSVFETTVLSEWNLVCGRNFLVELSITVFMVGATGGALLIMPLSDRWGRKRVMMGCLLCQACVGTATAFVHSYAAFTVLRFIIGMLNIGVGLCCYVLMTETFPAAQRTAVSIAFQAFWALGVMTVAGFGFLLRNWRHLELLLSLPSLLALPCWWLLPESLPWLISQKRWREAVSTITTIAAANGKDAAPITLLIPSTTHTSDPTHPTCCHHDNSMSSANHDAADSMFSSSGGEGVAESDIDAVIDREGCGNVANHVGNGVHHADDVSAHMLAARPGDAGRKGGCGDVGGGECCVNGKRQSSGEEQTASPQVSASILDLFRHRQMCVYSCVMFFLFFVNSLGYFGISFSVPVLHGNQFVNLCIMGAVELPANVVCVFVSHRVGRRYPNAAFLLLCGVANVAAIFCPPHIAWLKLTCVMVGKFAITAAYSTIYLYSAEIFPTVIRNQAMGMSSVFENVGSIVAPFIVHAAKSVPEVPLVVFGVLTVCGACLTLLLPETHRRPLPQTVQEITAW